VVVVVLLLVVLSRGYQLVHDERHTAGLCLAGQDMTVSICVVCVACDCVEEVCACVGGGGGGNTDTKWRAP
jgi:hypothetical protein